MRVLRCASIIVRTMLSRSRAITSPRDGDVLQVTLMDDYLEFQPPQAPTDADSDRALVGVSLGPFPLAASRGLTDGIVQSRRTYRRL